MSLLAKAMPSRHQELCNCYLSPHLLKVGRFWLNNSIKVYSVFSCKIEDLCGSFVLHLLIFHLVGRPFKILKLVGSIPNPNPVHPPLTIYLVYPARALRALGLLLADGVLTVGWGKTFWRLGRVPSRKWA